MSRLALILLVSTVGLAAAPVAAGEILVDRIVAVVDEDPIYLSDIRRVLALGRVAVADGESDRGLERRVLDGLIDQRLRFHEVERYDFGALETAEIDRQLAEVRRHHPDAAAFAAYLAGLGLTEAGLRQLLERQLRVLAYIEQRLGPRVFVDPEDVRAYYDGELRRKAAREGLGLPPFGEIRDQIRDLLREIRLNREIDAWTEELRREAEIVDHLERLPRELPPVVERLEMEEGAEREEP